MKALVYTNPNTVELRDVPEPLPANDEVLVKVDAVGICGSDMHAFHGRDARRPAPLILGHEASGVVATGPNKGKRVAVDPLVTCGSCEHCASGRSHLCLSRQIISMPPRPGAFAEILRIPERNLVSIPDGLESSKAALTEPLAVSYHAVKRGAQFLPKLLSESVCAVLGGGAIGLGCALVLAMHGAKTIHLAEPHDARRAAAKSVGPFRCYAPATTDEPADSSLDLVLDAVGADSTRAAASRMVKPGGVIVHVGLLPGTGGLDIRKVTLQEITFTGTYCYTHQDFCETLAAMVAGRLGVLDWFEERPLSHGAQAFRDLDVGKVVAGKLILRP